MAEILSQAEIDALLTALSTGEGHAEEVHETDTRKVKPYDFKHPERFSRDHVRALQMVHEQFGRLCSASLSALMRSLCEVKLISTDQLSYDEFIRSIPTPTFINIINVPPGNGTMIFEFSPSLSYTIVDRLLGGAGAKSSIHRELSEIEKAILMRIVDRFLECMTESWANVMPLNFALEASETNPQLFLQLLLPSEMTILLTFEVTLTESIGTVSLCIPYPAIEDILPRLSARTWFTGLHKSSNPEMETVLRHHMNAVPLDLRVFLGRTELSIQELLELRPGDVVPLETRQDGEVTVLIGGEEKYFGTPGTRRQHRAVRVTRPVPEEK